MSLIRYRPELDGIRAVAVVAVLIFHAEKLLLPGGFLGVDVFFVLSGFLITSILYMQFQEGLPIKQFWIKRVRRIIPALVGAIAFTLLIGSAVLLRVDRELLLGHAITALLSLSNFFILAQTRGYWSVHADSLPLLHTWSLSVEEQFYLVFPIVLLLIYKWNRKYILPAIAALAACSFLWPWLMELDPSKRFLFSPYRAWEILLGALLAVAQLQGKLCLTKNFTFNCLLQAVAVLALCASFIIIDVHYVFKTPIPLLACIATVVLIYSLEQDSFLKRFFSHDVMVYIGKRSYSFYLYHWPIIVFWKFLDPEPNILLVALASLVCAEVSYRFIERPFRYESNPFHKLRNWIPATALPLGLLLLAVFPHPFAVSKALTSLSLEGISDRGSQEIKDIVNGTPTGIPSANWNAGTAPDILLVGSSHAVSLYEELAAFCTQNGISLVSLARSAEGIVGDTETNLARIKYAKMLQPDAIILFSHFSREVEAEGLHRYEEAVREWASISNNLVIIDSPPVLRIPPHVAPSLQYYLVHLDLTGRKLSVDVHERDVMPLRNLARSIPNTTWISTMPMFAENGKCRFLPDGSIPYADLYHLNPLGIRYLIQQELGETILSILIATH